MKNKFHLLPLLALAIPLLWYGCQNDIQDFEMKSFDEHAQQVELRNNDDVCGTTTWDLTAGQTIDVGSVIVENDGENIYITYSLDLESYPNACFGDLHAWVGQSLDELPKGGDKRPAPGQLCKLPGSACFDAQGATSHMFTIPLSELGIMNIDDACDDMLYVVTHAEVDLDCDPLTTDDQETAFGGPIPGGGSAWWFYGAYGICCPSFCIEDAQLLATENNVPEPEVPEMEARIWSITSTGTSTLLSNIPAPVNNNTGNFNGNAYDPVNQRFYFTEFARFNTDEGGGPTELYFNDLQGNQQYVGDLTGGVAGGTIYDGKYYYIANRTDDLYEVTFNPDGTINSEVKIADIFGNAGGYDQGDRLGGGDITVNPADEWIYASITRIPGFTAVFAKMQLDGTGYTEIQTGGLYGAGAAQIAFGADGVLYGVNAGDPFELFSIDPATGNTTFIANTSVPFSDLAAGPACQ